MFGSEKFVEKVCFITFDSDCLVYNCWSGLEMLVLNAWILGLWIWGFRIWDVWDVGLELWFRIYYFGRRIV